MRRWLSVFGFVLALSTLSSTAEAAVVERVIAVVGDRAILLSDLRNRARPLLTQLYRAQPKGPQRAAAISQMYKELLERMVDEELERRAANRARITISAREIDEAMERIARQNGIAVEKLISEALDSGLTRIEYRQEIRRQLLEAKLLNLRVSGRIRITDDDLRVAYRDYVLQERSRLKFRMAWIRVFAPLNADKNVSKKQRALAQSVAKRARAGEDFAALARKYSSDPSKEQGGLLPEMRPRGLPAALRRTLVNMEVGDVSTPIRSGNDWVIMRLVQREQSELPTYQEARVQLRQRVYMDKMQKGRDLWLKQLRKQTHVDVRL